MEQKLERKKKCQPLINFKIDLNEDSKEDVIYLKNFVSIFDLNPFINNLIFQKIPEYHVYLDKYKYTLFYKDAKALGCFQEVDEKELINNVNEKIKKCIIGFPFSFEDIKINKIESLSKIKLMDFFLYLLIIKPELEDYQDIIEYINSLKLKIDLVFKTPIDLGYHELKYYFYYEIFIELFLFNSKEESKKKKGPKIKRNIFKSKDLVYFPQINNNDDDFILIDQTDFEKRKNELFNFINVNPSVEGDIFEDSENQIYENQTIELDEDKYLENKKDEKENTKINKNDYYRFSKKLEYFQVFETSILYIFFGGSDNDEQILEKIKFIYFFIILLLQTSSSPLPKLANAFYPLNDDKDKERFKGYKKIIKELFNNENDLVLKNIIVPADFFEFLANPFINNYLAFPFPVLLHKNFLEYDRDIYNEFLEFLKYIYKSELIQDIYYLCPEFKDFDYPFKDDNILEEMFNNTYFLPCNSKNLYGYTQKNLASVFIPAMINIESGNKVELFIIKLGFLLNTIIHEQLKHYIKALIFFNSFRFGIKSHIESDEDLNNEENIVLKGLMKKRERKKKIKSLSGKDGGRRTEILLYGQVLERLSCIQGLKMFYKSTWNTSIKKHFCDFNDNYGIEKKNKEIDNESFFGLNIVFNDDDVCPFFKKILRKFTDCKNIKSEKALIDLKYSANKEPENCDNKLELNINLNFEEDMKRPNVRDYSP